MNDHRIAVLEARVKMLEDVVEKLVAKTQPKAGFKVGGRVRVMAWVTSNYAGQVGTVTGVADVARDELPITVHFDSGFSSYYRPDELEHA